MHGHTNIRFEENELKVIHDKCGGRAKREFIERRYQQIEYLVSDVTLITE